jgi:hypothetical protein
MQDTSVIPSSQYVSIPGCQCIHTVSNKFLSHNCNWITKTTAVFIENDAIGAYNQLINYLVLMTIQKLGLPPNTAACLGEIWNDVVHSNKTIYGIKSSMYDHTEDQPLYGPRQTFCYCIRIQSLVSISLQNQSF